MILKFELNKINISLLERFLAFLWLHSGYGTLVAVINMSLFCHYVCNIFIS